MVTVVPEPAGGEVRTESVQLSGSESSSVIDDIVREGVRRMLAEAVQAEVEDYLVELAAERDEHGRRLVVDRAVAALVASQSDGGSAEANARQAMSMRLDEAQTRLGRLRDAIEVGVDPAALVEAINQEQAQRAAARGARRGCASPGHPLRRRGLRDD